MTIGICDTETTIRNKGNAFTRTNKLVLVGIKLLKDASICYNATQIKDIQQHFNTLKLLVFFNGKFDLHWLRRVGVKLPESLRVWDCQLAHFILTGQEKPYPSLDEVAAYYDLGQKIDKIKLEYWDKGIDTDQIPKEELEEYLTQDLSLTEQVYLCQVEQFQRGSLEQYRLFLLHCRDLLVLEDMEFNGMLFDTEQAKILLEKGEQEITEIEKQLQSFFPDVPINWNSRDHISCCLYGGTIIDETRVPVGVYKTGIKAGEIRYKLIEVKYEIPKMVEPLRGSELKKDGYWATDEPTLGRLRGSKTAKRFINLLLQRAEQNKLCGTYYRGVPELIETMDWPPSRVHGQFNQTVAATGRLSSSKPNLQNFAGIVDKLLISEYD